MIFTSGGDRVYDNIENVADEITNRSKNTLKSRFPIRNDLGPTASLMPVKKYAKFNRNNSDPD